MRPTSSSRLLGLLLSLLSLRSYHSFAPPPAATRHPLGLSRTVQDRSPAATRHPLGLSRTVQDRWGLVAAAEGRTAEPWAAKKTAGEGQAGNEEADNRRQVASSSAVSFVAASWLLLATLGLAGGSTDAAWADEFAEDADGNYVGVAVSQSFEGEIDAAMKQLDGAKNAGQVLEAMGGMAKAVGINNAEGEMNVFAPSFRRATATQLAELKAKNKNTGLWDGGDVAEVYGFLKRQMDPYHIIEIKGYLQVAPFLGAAAYLALLGVQKFLPDNLFEPAYLLGALVVFGPLAALYFSA